MQLEDYFEFEKFETKHGLAECIRIKGHRIAIERVIEQFNAGLSPEAIVRDHYPTLTLAEVYATIAYYLHNKSELDEYVRKGDEVADAYYQEYLKRGPYFLKEDAERQRLSGLADGNDSAHE